jgi:hypothetical protein
MAGRGGAILAALVLCWWATAAAAETRTLLQVGAWEAFGGTTSGSGRKVCGVSTQQSGKYFSVKYFAGDDTATIQMGSGGWRIDDDTEQKLHMRFDAASPWHATGTGMHFSDGDAGLEFTVARRQLDKFMSEFRANNSLIIDFDDTAITGWSIWLAGSNAVSQAFLRCADAL